MQPPRLDLYGGNCRCIHEQRASAVSYIACLMLFVGCAHRNGSFAPLPLNRPISRETAITIAKQEVRAREKWKRVDCDAQSRGDGWKVWVCPKPVRLIDPVAVVIMDDNGRLTSYHKLFNYE